MTRTERDASSLEVFKARLDGTLGSLELNVELVALPVVVGLELHDP